MLLSPFRVKSARAVLATLSTKSLGILSHQIHHKMPPKTPLHAIPRATTTYYASASKTMLPPTFPDEHVPFNTGWALSRSNWRGDGKEQRGMPSTVPVLEENATGRATTDLGMPSLTSWASRTYGNSGLVRAAMLARHPAPSSYDQTRRIEAELVFGVSWYKAYTLRANVRQDGSYRGTRTGVQSHCQTGIECDHLSCTRACSISDRTCN